MKGGLIAHRMCKCFTFVPVKLTNGLCMICRSHGAGLYKNPAVVLVCVV